MSEADAGVTCPAEDAPALSRAVLHLKSLPSAELERLGIAGRDYYQQHFDPVVLTQRLLECLSLISRPADQAGAH